MIDIAVQHVSKRYMVPSDHRGVRGLLGLMPRRTPVWAVRDVSFEVQRGEALGIVGPNGSGKTTLVKLLSSITAPTEGEIVLRGHLSAMVAVGAGFNPELTGRENIFLSGSILGMSPREISRKIADIVEFAGVGDYIEVPVKKYSSGMFVRLGFSIAAHLDADILLLDEVLAVGDAAFQVRCFDRVDDLRKSGRTIVLVSHDLAAIERICTRAILLQSGQIVTEGKPHAVTESYQARTYAALPDPSRLGDPPKRIASQTLTFSGPNDGPVRTGDSLLCRLSYEAREPLADLLFKVSFNWPSGYLCAQLSCEANGFVEPGRGEVEFFCPMLSMQRGLYSVDIAIERAGEVLDWRPRCALLRVDPGKVIDGDFYIEHRSRVTQLLARS